MVEPMNEQAYQFKTWLNVKYDLVWKIRTFYDFLWPKILIIKFKTFYDSAETLRMFLTPYTAFFFINDYCPN